MTKKTRGPKRTPAVLTEAELEMMTVLWRLGPSSVAQIQQELGTARELAYTSVSTIVRILEQKGYVTSEKIGRGHVYAAAVAKESYQAASVSQLISKVFDGTPATLVRSLLASESLSAGEISEIKALLARKED